MKKNEIKKLTKEQMLENIKKFKKDLFNLRFQKINGQVKNPAKIRETKKKYCAFKNISRSKKCLKKY